MLNLDRNARIGIVAVLSILCVGLLVHNRAIIGKTVSVGLVIGALGVIGYFAYEMKLLGGSEESFGDYTSQSPVESNNQTPRCYSNGEEVDCELLESEDDVADNQNESANDNGAVNGSYGVGNDEVYKPVENTPSNNKLPNECYPKDILSPSELLPKDADSVWAQSVPSGQGSLGDQNFLNAGFHVGMNTVGQTLRNGNRQLRSDPPNPQVKVSPWMQTTIEPDTNRKPLEIGN